MSAATVNLWGRRVGAVSIEGPGALPAFEYDRAFAASGIEVSPIEMPLARHVYEFPSLARSEAFLGLPGMLADALPDRWGRTLVDGWLAAQGRTPADFDVVERLCYLGSRGMGALEFAPATAQLVPPEGDLQVDLLVELANAALSSKEDFVSQVTADHRRSEVAAMISLGTSAGGARPKALIAYNEQTGQVRSGQVETGPEFRQLLIKFDGVIGSGDHGLADPQGWGAIEFAYSLMARAAGIEMTDCRLLEENGRRHFMTERFDRAGSSKLHMQTLAALEHADFNAPGEYSYEHALRLIRRLGLDARAAEELFRRMVFNVLARNQDDHVKNTAFTMNQAGQWALAPAYDLTWAYKPGNRWLEAHQMSLAGKRDDFVLHDLKSVADFAGLRRGRWREIVDQVGNAVAHWPEFAAEAAVSGAQVDEIAATHRLALLG